MDKFVYVAIPINEWGIKPNGEILKAAQHNLLCGAYKNKIGKAKRKNEFIELEYSDGTKQIMFVLQKGEGSIEPPKGGKIIRRLNYVHQF